MSVLPGICAIADHLNIELTFLELCSSLLTSFSHMHIVLIT